MTKPRDVRRPRRTFPPEVERQIRRENAAFMVAGVLSWAFVGAAITRAFRLW